MRARAIVAVLVLAAGAGCSKPQAESRDLAAASVVDGAAVRADAGGAGSSANAAAGGAGSAAPASVPETTTTTRPLTPAERLHLMVAGVAGRDVAVSVVDDQGGVVIEHRPDAALIPASTAKLLTAGAALAELGPDYRFRTRINSTAFVVDGVINGDLVLIGGGDPTLTGGLHGQVMPDRPRTVIEALADQVVASGARRVTGRLVGDPSVFPHAPYVAGVDVGGDSTTMSSGLTVNGGRRVWVDGTRGIQSAVSDNPTLEAANVLLEALATRGVTVDGGTAVAEAAAAAPVPLGEMASPPLIELLRYMVQTSDNHIADAAFRAIGAKHRDASWAGAARVVAATVAAFGLPATEFAVADGSGLSRLNRTTPRGLVQLDRLMASSRFAAQWYSLHAVAGSSGTLRNRLVDTVASGRVAGKTGTLRDVRAFTGFVTDGARPRFRIAILGNGLDADGADAVVRMQDEMSLLLAERAASCATEPACPLT